MLTEESTGLVGLPSLYLLWSAISIRSLSQAPIFVTADFVWGPDESHYSEHRYIVSALCSEILSPLEGLNYYLEDRYLTVRKYDQDADEDILGSEKQEILARLRRVKAEVELKKP